jgi:hypothetical protein
VVVVVDQKTVQAGTVVQGVGVVIQVVHELLGWVIPTRVRMVGSIQHTVVVVVVALLKRVRMHSPQQVEKGVTV